MVECVRKAPEPQGLLPTSDIEVNWSQVWKQQKLGLSPAGIYTSNIAAIMLDHYTYVNTYTGNKWFLIWFDFDLHTVYQVPQLIRYTKQRWALANFFQVR